MGSNQVGREIEFELTREEIAKKAERIAELSMAISVEQDRFLGERTTHKALVKSLELDIDKELAAVRSRKETRMVMCDVVRNFDANSIEYYSEGKLMLTRAMDSSERQQELSGVDPGAGDPQEPQDDDFPEDGDEEDDPDDGEEAPIPEKIAANGLAGGPV